MAVNGHVPEGWRRVSLSLVASPRNQRAGAVNGTEVFSVTKHSGMVKASDYFDRQVHSRDTSNYKIVRKGDLAYATIHLDEGSLGILRTADIGLISPMYTVFEADRKQIEPEFLFAVMKLPAMVANYRRLGEGSVHRRKSVSFDRLGRVEFVIPELIEEQRAIIAVLDSIDDAIEGTQEVIDANERLRTGLIQNLLSRGVPGWHAAWSEHPILGTVPKDWDTVPLGRSLSDIEAGSSPKCRTRPATVDEWGVLKVSAVSWGYFQPEENKALLPRTDYDPDMEVRTGDLLISRANTPELIGRAVLVRETRPRLLISDKTLRLIPDTGLTDSEFLNLILSHSPVRRQIEGAASGSSRSMYNISQKILRQIMIPLPRLKEQTAIKDAVKELDSIRSIMRNDLKALVEVKIALSQSLLSGEQRVSGRINLAY